MKEWMYNHIEGIRCLKKAVLIGIGGIGLLQEAVIIGIGGI